MTEKTYSIARIDELDSFPVDEQGLTWRPIRRHFDIKAFGVNAYTAEKAGDRVVEEHREQDGHEELYVVVSGHATFTLDGDDQDAPAGTLVFIRDPALRRSATTIAPVRPRMRSSPIDFPAGPPSCTAISSKSRSGPPIGDTASRNAATCGLSTSVAISRPAVE